MPVAVGSRQRRRGGLCVRLHSVHIVHQEDFSSRVRVSYLAIILWELQCPGLMTQSTSLITPLVATTNAPSFARSLLALLLRSFGCYRRCYRRALLPSAAHLPSSEINRPCHAKRCELHTLYTKFDDIYVQRIYK